MQPVLTSIPHPKDFIETAEGLLFAVVTAGLEQGKALCFLRYRKTASGWQKLATDQANKLLAEHYPAYLHHSERLDARLHAVPARQIIKHHQPSQRLQQLLTTVHRDTVENDLIQLVKLFQEKGLELAQMGVTGSILAGLQNPHSDIDLLCYQAKVFHQCRGMIRELQGSGHLQALTLNDWRQSYQRRSCALTFAEYLWHEQRKYNKAMINGRKFDLSLVEEPSLAAATQGKHSKQQTITLQCRVIDDHKAFAYPAEYAIDHEEIGAVVSFTATYAGQAQRGEWIEVAGTLESAPQGLRIVVGSSREAPGEYIKVVDAGHH